MTSKKNIPFLFPATLYKQFACQCVARRQAEAHRLEGVMNWELGIGNSENTAKSDRTLSQFKIHHSLFFMEILGYGE